MVIRRDLNTCSSQSAMHHGVPVRVFFRRSSEHHSRNDSRSSTSWSHDSHVYSRSRTLVVPRTFLRVPYNNIHHHVAFARELEKKRKKHRAGPTNSTFHFSFSCGIAYSRGNRTPGSEKKQTLVYLIKRKMKMKILVYVPGTYISPVIAALGAGVNSNPSSRDIGGTQEIQPSTWLRITSLHLAET